MSKYVQKNVFLKNKEIKEGSLKPWKTTFENVCSGGLVMATILMQVVKKFQFLQLQFLVTKFQMNANTFYFNYF